MRLMSGCSNRTDEAWRTVDGGYESMASKTHHARRNRAHATPSSASEGRDRATKEWVASDQAQKSQFDVGISDMQCIFRTRGVFL
jgi:hypothetical protein